MAERAPEPHLPHWRRAWRDAEAVYRSPWFHCSVGVAATAATVAGAVLPADASAKLKVVLAIASAAGVPLVLGAFVLTVTFVLAPRKRREDTLEARIESLEEEQSLAGSSNITINAPGSNFHFGGEHPVRGLPVSKPDDE